MTSKLSCREIKVLNIYSYVYKLCMLNENLKEKLTRGKNSISSAYFVHFYILIVFPLYLSIKYLLLFLNSLSLSSPISHSLFLSLYHSFFTFLSLSLSFSISICVSLSLYLFPYLTFSFSHTLSFPFSLYHSLSKFLFPSLCLFPYLSLSLSFPSLTTFFSISHSDSLSQTLFSLSLYHYLSDSPFPISFNFMSMTKKYFNYLIFQEIFHMEVILF